MTVFRSIATEDLRIPSDTAGIELLLRHKALADASGFGAERTVLLMHGATYASTSLFDVPAGGASLMDELAAHGFDVYALDVRGYGGSTRPVEMAEGSDAAPAVRTEAAVRDLGSAIDFILQRAGIARLNVVAMSWGGSVAGAYTAAHGDKVAKLALIAPLWLLAGPLAIDPGEALAAARWVDVAAFHAAWTARAPASERAALIPAGWFDAWVAATLATEPEGPATGRIRVPNGALLDVREHWTVGKPLYNPSAIRVPVLLIHAEWDELAPFETMRDLFGRFTGAPYRRWVEIGEGTHMLVLEKNRWQLSAAILGFLSEVRPQ